MNPEGGAFSPIDRRESGAKGQEALMLEEHELEGRLNELTEEMQRLEHEIEAKKQEALNAKDPSDKKKLELETNDLEDRHGKLFSERNEILVRKTSADRRNGNGTAT